MKRKASGSPGTQGETRKQRISVIQRKVQVKQPVEHVKIDATEVLGAPGDVEEPIDCLVDKNNVHLKLEKLIGRGQHGNAYIAVPTKDSKEPPAILKVAHFDTLGIFENEVEAATAAGKIGVGPQVYDAWICEAHGELRGLIMMEQLGDAFPLSKLLPAASSSTDTPIPGAENLLRLIITQLDKLSSAGWVHRDVHDNNILVNKDLSKAWLIDYGRAVRLNNGSPGSNSYFDQTVKENDIHREVKWAQEQKWITQKKITPQFNEDVWDVFEMLTLAHHAGAGKFFKALQENDKKSTAARYVATAVAGPLRTKKTAGMKRKTDAEEEEEEQKKKKQRQFTMERVLQIQKPVVYVPLDAHLSSFGITRQEAKGCLVDKHGVYLELGKLLGAGAWGYVYPVIRANDSKEPPAVLKITRFASRREFDSEAEASVAAGKAGVGPEVYDAWVCEAAGDPPRGFILMERLVDALTLDEMQDANKSGLPIPDAARIVEMLVRQLDRLYTAGWVQNDLNLSNVMVNKDHSKLWVIDYGEALRFNSQHEWFKPRKTEQWYQETKLAVERKWVHSSPISAYLDFTIHRAFNALQLDAHNHAHFFEQFQKGVKFTRPPGEYSPGKDITFSGPYSMERKRATRSLSRGGGEKSQERSGREKREAVALDRHAGLTRERIEACLKEFHLARLLGKGAFGTVYEVVAVDNKHYAAKIQDLDALDPRRILNQEERTLALAKRRADFAAEVMIQEVAGNLGLSPRMVASGRCTDWVSPITKQKLEIGWILMDLIHGRTLNASKSTVSQTILIRMLNNLLELAVKFFRATGILHKDLHDENVFYDPNAQRLYILDWGMVSTWDKKEHLVGTLQEFMDGQVDEGEGFHNLSASSLLQYIFHFGGNSSLFDDPAHQLNYGEVTLLSKLAELYPVKLPTWTGRFDVVRRLFLSRNADNGIHIPVFTFTRAGTMNTENVTAATKEALVSIDLDGEVLVKDRLVANFKDMAQLETDVATQARQWSDEKSVLTIIGFVELKGPPQGASGKIEPEVRGLEYHAFQHELAMVSDKLLRFRVKCQFARTDPRVLTWDPVD